ncbi:MAG: hypothetical protein GY758_08945 [Fuerstiella sp.]|jgi:hypothetical protein|nr:hypothetical protein [Fuerstiella sp.]MCP4509862.1 hypothetical protein [Fuerstiella sp.]MDG2129897.1 hypothetical protein [Fuerstiella sp.]
MLKTKTEKRAAIVLTAILVLTLGHDVVTGFLLEPFDRRGRDVNVLQQKIADAEFEIKLTERAQHRLRESVENSLPADPIIATLQFQDWLVKTTEEVGLAGVNVGPGRALEEEGVGYRIPFTLTCSGNPEQLADLLACLKNSTVLHRVNHLTMTPGRDEDDLNISMSVEVAALRNGKSRTIPSMTDVARKTQRASELKELLADRRPFQRYSQPKKTKKPENNRKKPPKTAAPAKKPVPPKVYLLVACVVHEAGREAWLCERATEDRIVLRESDHISCQKGDLQIDNIGPDFVLFRCNGISDRLSLGECLTQIQE